jgi:hypothetical protein
MSKKPRKVEMVEETAGRFLVKTYADGAEERDAIEKRPRKKRYGPPPIGYGSSMTSGTD